MVDEMHNKLYPQSSNKVETLRSYTSDNECGVRLSSGKGERLDLETFFKDWESVLRDGRILIEIIRKRKRGQWKRENESRTPRRQRTKNQ